MNAFTQFIADARAGRAVREAANAVATSRPIRRASLWYRVPIAAIRWVLHWMRVEGY